MPGEPTPVTFRHVLKNRRFFALWLAQFVSNFGDWLALLALWSLAAFSKQGTASEVSGILISFILPAALLGPVAGVFVDRWSPKTTMIASDLIRAVIAALLVVPTAVYQIYPLVFALSAVSIFFLPAQGVAIPMIVRKEELLVANALNAQTIQINRIISPAIAGLVVAWLGVKACFVIDSATFIFSAVMLSTIPLARIKSDSVKSTRSVRKEFFEGLRFIRHHRAILFVILSIVAALVALGAFDALIVVYVRDILHSEARLFGLIVSLSGIGTIVGSFLIGRFGQSHRKVYMVTAGILTIGVNILIMAAFASAPMVLVVSLGFGLAAAYVLVPSQTLIQQETPHEMLGRVNGTSMSLMTIAQLSSIAVAGTVASWIGIINLYLVIGVILILTAAFGFMYASLGLKKEMTPAPARFDAGAIAEAADDPLLGAPPDIEEQSTEASGL